MKYQISGSKFWGHRGQSLKYPYLLTLYGISPNLTPAISQPPVIIGFLLVNIINANMSDFVSHNDIQVHQFN